MLNTYKDNFFHFDLVYILSTEILVSLELILMSQYLDMASPSKTDSINIDFKQR